MLDPIKAPLNQVRTILVQRLTPIASQSAALTASKGKKKIDKFIDFKLI